jgi:hypothetical protein
MSLGLAMPACATRLPTNLSNMLSLAVVISSWIAASIAAKNQVTRALAMIVGLLGASAFLHKVSWFLAIDSEQQTSLSLAWVSRGISTFSLALLAVASVMALTWLTTGRRRRWAPWAVFAMMLAIVSSWTVENVQSLYQSPFLHIWARGMSRLLLPPRAFAPAGLAAFVSSLVFFLGWLALISVHRKRELRAALSLALIAGIQMDIPICALSLTLASLMVVDNAFVETPELSKLIQPTSSSLPANDSRGV